MILLKALYAFVTCRNSMPMIALVSALMLPTVVMAAGPDQSLPSATQKQLVEKALAEFAVELSRKHMDVPEMRARLRAFLVANREIVGSAFAYAPKVEGAKPTAIYVCRKGEELIDRDLPMEYDLSSPEGEWYSGPVKTKKPYWTKPYFDTAGAGIDMVTFSIPLYDKAGAFIGLVTADLALKK